MQILVWAGTFLLLAVVGSMVSIAGMIGMPIADGVQAGVMVMAVLVLGSGLALVTAARRAAPLRAIAVKRDPVALI